MKTKCMSCGGSMKGSSKTKMGKGGTAGGTALKNALIKAGYEKGGSVNKKK